MNMERQMNTVEIAQLIAQSGGAGRFEGEDHGSPVSFFFVTSPPGKGASKHRHPYIETFVVIEGEIEAIVGGEMHMLHGGTIAMIPANTWHEFKNRSTRNALMVNIHPVPRMVQEDWTPELDASEVRLHANR
ncbi:cupin domain-containing protein [Salinibacterium sp. ZJ450]|uniref:cupin domain-containing protein n=1 Tax=Salinibacterium sp. ZJ450 TaxID=2708338 RepID=UPI0014235E5F|nr:cupin domain-containing protein [Salinibacterium sp. ZJ450]